MNVCCFTGTLGQDWTVEYNNDGKPRAKTSMAIRKYNGDTMWINLVAFGKKCETLSQYTKKGDKLPVVCELDVHVYEKDNSKAYYHNFIVQTFALVGKKDQSNNNQQQGQGNTGGFGGQSSNGQGNFQQQGGGFQHSQPQQQGGFGMDGGVNNNMDDPPF